MTARERVENRVNIRQVERVELLRRLNVAEENFYRASRCINTIDDYFEYEHLSQTPETIALHVQGILADYTREISDAQ
mgnify:CR=1 FL=1